MVTGVKESDWCQAGHLSLHWENLFSTRKDDRPKTNSQRTPENGPGLPPKREQRLSSNHPFSGASYYGSFRVPGNSNLKQLQSTSRSEQEKKVNLAILCDLFGMVIRDLLERLSDLQRSRIKRSWLESPGT